MFSIRSRLIVCAAILFISSLGFAQEKSEQKLKHISIVVDNNGEEEYYLCSWFEVIDALSAYGEPDALPRLSGGNEPQENPGPSYLNLNWYARTKDQGYKRIVFLRSMNNYDEGIRYIKFTNLDGEKWVDELTFYYESRDGHSIPGLRPSHYEYGLECEFTDYSDNWEDILRYYWKGGWAYFKLDNVKRIIYNYE